MQRRWAIFSVLALGACVNFEVATPDPSRDDSDRTLVFSARSLEHGEWVETPVLEVEERRGGFAVDARLSAPDPCRTISAELQGTGSEVVIEVEIRPTSGGGCLQIIGTFAYEAVVDGLAPGAYHLQVIHRYPSTGWPTATVLDRQVQVR